MELVYYIGLLLLVFIMIIILSGIILIYKFLIKQSNSPIDIIFKSIILFASLYFIIVFILMFSNTKLIAPLGIILASFIASASVMKSINNTIQLEEERKKEEKNKAIKRFNIYTYQLSHSLEKESENFSIGRAISHFDEYLKNIQNDNNLISNLDLEDIFEFIYKAKIEIQNKEKDQYQAYLKEIIKEVFSKQMNFDNN